MDAYSLSTQGKWVEIDMKNQETLMKTDNKINFGITFWARVWVEGLDLKLSTKSDSLVGSFLDSLILRILQNIHKDYEESLTKITVMNISRSSCF